MFMESLRLCIIVLYLPHRMFTTFPKTKTYFGHLDISPGSGQLRNLGKKIVVALAEETRHISTPVFTTNLGYLSRYHAFQLRIDPTNFKVKNVLRYWLCLVVCWFYGI